MPRLVELKNVSGPGSGGKQGAGFAAGWIGSRYWTGVTGGVAGYAFIVYLSNGLSNDYGLSNGGFAACLPI